jgi:hypothetical protein
MFRPLSRWLMDRTDSVFRQRARGNWGDVVAQVASELARQCEAF